MIVVTKHKQTLDARHEDASGVRGTLSCAEACKFADVVLISVKPQSIREVLAEIDAVVTPQKLVITTVASVPTSFVESTLGAGIAVIRTMPNTPCLIRRGMVAIAPGGT